MRRGTAIFISGIIAWEARIFDLTVDGVTVPQKAGDWSFIKAGLDHSLLAKPGKEVFYVWVEYFTEEDLQKYYLCQIFNGSLTEAK